MAMSINPASKLVFGLKPKFEIKVNLDDRLFFSCGKSVSQLLSFSDGKSISVETVYPSNQTRTPAVDFDKLQTRVLLAGTMPAALQKL